MTNDNEIYTHEDILTETCEPLSGTVDELCYYQGNMGFPMSTIFEKVNPDGTITRISGTQFTHIQFELLNSSRELLGKSALFPISVLLQSTPGKIPDGHVSGLWTLEPNKLSDQAKFETFPKPESRL